MRNKRTALDENGNKVPAINWFASSFNPESADNLKSFLSMMIRYSACWEKNFPETENSSHTVNSNRFLSEIDSNARESGKGGG